MSGRLLLAIGFFLGGEVVVFASGLLLAVVPAAALALILCGFLLPFLPASPAPPGWPRDLSPFSGKWASRAAGPERGVKTL